MQNNRAGHSVPGANHGEKLPQLLQKLHKSGTLVGWVRVHHRMVGGGVRVGEWRKCVISGGRGGRGAVPAVAVAFADACGAVMLWCSVCV